MASIVSKNSKDPPETGAHIHSLAHRQPSYRSDDIGSDSSDNFDNSSNSNSLNQVQEFGDLLRESLSTRQKEQRQEKRRRWVPGTGKFLNHRNRSRPASEHEPILAIQEKENTEEKIDGTDNIIKNNSTSSATEAFDDEPDAAISGDDNDSKERTSCIGNVFSGCLLFIFSCLITRIGEVTDGEVTDGEEKDDEEQGCSAERNTKSSRESSTSSWELNWKRIGYCFSVMVFLEVLLVIGLLVAFLMYDGG